MQILTFCKDAEFFSGITVWNQNYWKHKLRILHGGGGGLSSELYLSGAVDKKYFHNRWLAVYKSRSFLLLSSFSYCHLNGRRYSAANSIACFFKWRWMLCGSEMKGRLHWSITSFGYLWKAGLKKLRWVKPAVIIFLVYFFGGQMFAWFQFLKRSCIL